MEPMHQTVTEAADKVYNFRVAVPRALLVTLHCVGSKGYVPKGEKDGVRPCVILYPADMPKGFESEVRSACQMAMYAACLVYKNAIDEGATPERAWSLALCVMPGGALIDSHIAVTEAQLVAARALVRSEESIETLDGMLAAIRSGEVE